VGELGVAPIARRLPRTRTGVAIPAVFMVLALLFVGHAAGGRLKTPVVISPANGAVTDDVPAFAWKPVAGAEEYEFQLSADAGFNSQVLGHGKDHIRTKNTRATVVETPPNGRYWWRVRAIDKSGTTSPWSTGRSFKKNWGASVTLESPADGALIVYPSTPLELTWRPVPGAAKYRVRIGTSDDLSSLITINGQTAPVETAATTLTPVAPLADGATYYWDVTPLDAEGNPGGSSRVSWFRWSWPSTTTLRVTDVVSAPELYDPRLSWDRVPGAARYEVEINPTKEFAPGSKVCCSATTINTSISPTMVLKDNAYYWRVRAIDMDSHAGVWNCYGTAPGPCDADHLATFTKTFDNVPPTDPPSIKNLRMRDNLANPGVDMDAATSGYQTMVPILTWSPVPGASSYEVDITPYQNGGCVWSASRLQHHFTSNIALTSWTPLGSGWNLQKPYPDPRPVATDGPSLAIGKYCARVRARSDRAIGQEIYGDYTYLDCSAQAGNCSAIPGDTGWAFEWTGYPDGGACTPSCHAGYLGASDYLEPVHTSKVGQTPLFTWRPIAGAQSYFVIVAKDANLTNIVDYAFTQIPAYAPRGNFGPMTYSDEVTSYYWVVLPEQSSNGSGTQGDPLAAAARGFYKSSDPPTLLSPENDPPLPFDDLPTFQWDHVVGARTYQLQISQDPSFLHPLEDVTTDSTSYSSNTTYPAGVFYWRVRANDENGIGLNWSAARTFTKTLLNPVGSSTNPTRGDPIPTWSWSVVPGAVSYDVWVDLPDGTHKLLSGFRTPAMTPVLMYGTGIFQWKVRAEFPKVPFGLTPGPYSPTYRFTRTIGEPTGARADFAADHILLSWNPKAWAKRYRVQLSGTPDFSQLVENVVTDNASYAPRLKYPFVRLDTGHLYWRVAAMDEGNNDGDFTQPQHIKRIRRMEVSLRGSLKRRKRSPVVIFIRNFETAGGVPGATVRVSGAGIRRRARTDAGGAVRIVLRPKRRGVIVIAASKRGYLPASTRVAVH
jgi:hypothetical protein